MKSVSASTFPATASFDAPASFEPTDREVELMRFLADAILRRLDAGVLGFVCRKGGPLPGERWFEAAKVLEADLKPFDVIPKLRRCVGLQNASALVVYRLQYVSSPSAAEVLDGRQMVKPSSAAISAQAAALAYELATRALEPGPRLNLSLEAFAWNLEHGMPFKSAALALRMAIDLIDLPDLVARIPAWASMEAKLRRDHEVFLSRRARA